MKLSIWYRANRIFQGLLVLRLLRHTHVRAVLGFGG